MVDPYPYGESQRRITTKWAIAAIILAILLPPVGLLLGIVALLRLRSDASLQGKGLAIAAILVSVVLTAIGLGFWSLGLAQYSGAFSTQEFLRTQCVFPTGFTCIDFTATVDTVTIVLENTLGNDVTNIILTPKGCASSNRPAFRSGERATFTSENCKNRDATYNGEIQITYTDPQGNKRKESGTLTVPLD